MRKYQWLSVAVAILIALPVHAQSPRITPAGDPSIDNDTIYALVVDPRDHPDQPAVYLLDDGVIRLEPDGRVTQTFRYVTQVLTREAAEDWGERAFSYSPSRERLTVNWARVLDLEGRVISEGAAQEQESLAPVARRAPIYTDQVVRRLTLGGVAPGTIVDISWTTEVLDPLFPGDFFEGWSVTTPRLTRRSRLVVDMPQGFEPRIKEQNLGFQRSEELHEGRRILSWVTAEVERYEGEPFAALDGNTVLATIFLSPPLEWQDVARWYAELTAESYVLTDEIRQRLAEVVAGAATLQDSLKLVHRWVAQDFRYVSVSLGIGGYQPREPAEVLESLFGDCKDKSVFFIAAARELGVPAFPVLTSVMSEVEADLPSISQFDHMIAAVELGDGLIFVDLTSELHPWGAIPYVLHDEFGLLIRPDGSGQELKLPGNSPRQNSFHVLLQGEIGEDQTFVGSYVERRAGIQEQGLREPFTRTYSASEMERLVQNVANSLMQGASGAEMVAFDGRDLDAAVEISLRLEHARPLQQAGESYLFRVPLRNFASHRLIANLKARDERRFPIDAASVIGPVEDHWELRLTLPPGWRAQLPQAVEASSVFGEYRAEYVQDGREVRVARVMTGKTGVYPPGRIGELIAWLEAISEDDVANLVLVPPPAVNQAGHASARR